MTGLTGRDLEDYRIHISRMSDERLNDEMKAATFWIKQRLTSASASWWSDTSEEISAELARRRDPSIDAGKDVVSLIWETRDVS